MEMTPEKVLEILVENHDRIKLLKGNAYGYAIETIVDALDNVLNLIIVIGAETIAKDQK